MANIYGVEIKNFNRVFIEDIGASFMQGEMYLNDTFLTNWQRTIQGNVTDRFDAVEASKLSKLASRYCENLLEKANSDVEQFITDLVSMTEDEATYRRGLEKGFTTYVQVTDGTQVYGYYTPEISVEKVVGEDYHKQFVERAKTGLTERHRARVDIFTSLDDFEIKDPMKKDLSKKHESVER